VAWVLPSAHVFEGMRSVLLEGAFPWNHFWAAAGLDLVYLAIGIGTFRLAIDYARVHGKLLQMGE
jgi:ABC-2 type transport system permease protein